MIKIVQPLNNNVVMGYDRKKGEVIIIGTGIGFRAKKGDQVDESKIQKMFITGENKQLLEMIGAIPPEYFELVEEIFEKAKEEYGFLPKEKEVMSADFVNNGEINMDDVRNFKIVVVIVTAVQSLA